MLKTILKTLTFILILALIGFGVYWYLYLRTTSTTPTGDSTEQGGFSPFDRNNKPSGDTAPIENNTKQNIEDIAPEKVTEIPKLRQLYTKPVSGLSASSTKTSSIARFIDRGTGHIYEADSLSMEIKKISNTTLPKTYESFWNKNLTTFITRYIKDDTDSITNFYAELRSTGTSTSVTSFEIKGKYLSKDIDQIVVSPARDKVFTWNIEDGKGVGYISSFDETGKIKIVDTPLRQVTIDWPETNNVSITTKGSAVAMGYMYLIDIKTGTMKKSIGGVRGLGAKANRDITKIIYSYSKINGLLTSVINIKDYTSQEMVFKTLVDKCVWSTLRKNEVYCAVPTEIPAGIYPDDWYKGKVSFIDQIWHLDTTTGEVHLLANIVSLLGKLVDAVDLTLDTAEDYLYFINKRDLTPWSLDLNL